MSSCWSPGQPNGHCGDTRAEGEMADRTVLMVGTRKGLWLGTSDEAREDWEFTGPHFDMEEVYSCLVDRRGPTTVAGGTSSPRLGPQVRRSDDLARPGRTRRTARSASPTTPARPWSGSGSWSRGARTGSCTPAPSRRRLALDRPRRDVLARARCGTTRTGPSGTPGSGSGVPHGAAAPDRPVVGHGGAEHRRRLPDR